MSCGSVGEDVVDLRNICVPRVTIPVGGSSVGRSMLIRVSRGDVSPPIVLADVVDDGGLLPVRLRVKANEVRRRPTARGSSPHAFEKIVIVGSCVSISDAT